MNAEKIKKGLNACARDLNCNSCPYKGLRCTRLLMQDADDALRQLEAKVPKWISVEDRVPEQGQRVLFYTAGNRTVYIGRYLYTGLKGAVWFSTQTSSHMRNGGTYTASHWMPLPEPPEVRKNEVP